MPNVFLSYVRENQEEVGLLIKELQKHGINVWFDRNSITPGSRWKDAIRSAIRKGDYFIACFSEAYTSEQKTYMNEELTLAIEELRRYEPDHSWFIPVLLSECDVPARSIGAGETLLDINWIPLYEDWEAGIRKLLSVINPEIGNKDIVFALLRDLINDEDSNVRNSAVESLGKINYQNVGRYLIRAIKSENKDIRTAAAEALGRIDNKEAIPALIEALNDEDEEIRKSAALSLGNIGSKVAVPSLISALSDFSEQVRIAIILALGKIGKPNEVVVPILIDLMNNENNTIRNNAVKALRKIDSPEAVKALEDLKL